MLISFCFINMFTHNQYILASSSISRKSILKKCGFKFIQIKPKCNEEKLKKNINKSTKPSNITKFLSFEKAKSISQTKKYFDHYVIGCDTLIYLENKVFNKARNIKEANLKIRKLSGKTHKIVSGLTICKNGRAIWQCSETTNVKIKKLSTKEIKAYLSKTGPQILNSVGCYQIESLGPQIIENIKGDFFNVMGLPLFKLLKYFSEQK